MLEDQYDIVHAAAVNNLAFGGVMLIGPTLAAALVPLIGIGESVITGLSAIVFSRTVTAQLHLIATHELRGRVMSGFAPAWQRSGTPGNWWSRPRR
jgi:hypothetical protein